MLILRDLNQSYVSSKAIDRLLCCLVCYKWGPTNHFASKWSAFENVWHPDARLVPQSAARQQYTKIAM